jgi:hypothetical protein
MESVVLEELECLRAIYAQSPHDFLEFEEPASDLSGNMFSFSVKFSSFPVSLSFKLPKEYPEESPSDTHIDSQGVGMSRLQLFELRLRLGSVMAEKRGELVLFDLTDEVCDFAARVRGDIYDAIDDEEDEEEEEELENESLSNRRETFYYLEI